MAITPTIDYNTLARMSVPTTPSRSLGNYSGNMAPVVQSNAAAGLAQPQRSGWQKTNDFIGSPAGQLALGGAAAGFGMYASGKQAVAQRQYEEEQAKLKAEADREKMLATLGTTMATNATNRAVAAARPIGEAQKFAAASAKGNLIADLLGKGPMMPGNSAIAAAAGDLSRHQPSAEAISRLRAMYSEPATLQSLLSRDQDIAAINPNAAPTNYAQLSATQQESPLTRALMSQFADYRQNSQTQLDDSESYARKLLEQAIDGTSTPVGSGAARAASPFPQSPTGTAANGGTTASGSGRTNASANGGAATQSAAQPTQGASNTGAILRTNAAPISAHVAANGRPEWGGSYWEQMTAPQALQEGLEGGKPHDYYGGPDAPRVDQLTPKMQQAIKSSYGVKLKEDDIEKVLRQGWSYGKPAPKGFEYDEDTGLLKKKGSVLKTLGKIGIYAGAAGIIIGSGGTLTPVGAALVGAGAGAAAGAIDNGWKGALTGAAIGGVTGGVGGAIANSSLNTAQQIGANAALGAGTGAVTGGKQGALIGAAGGAGGASIGPATSKLSGFQQTAAQAGMNAGLTKAIGGSWTDAGLAAGQAANASAANQKKLQQYKQQQARGGAFDAAGRLVRG